MIKTFNGACHLHGDISSLFIDLVITLNSFIKLVEEEADRDAANTMLTLAGRLAVLSEEDLEANFEKIIEEFKDDPRL